MSERDSGTVPASFAILRDSPSPLPSPVPSSSPAIACPRAIPASAAPKPVWWRALAGLLLLGAALANVDLASLIARLSQLRVGYVLLAAALTVPQLYMLALRWRYTAGALGLPLSRREALREYSLSMLLNQLLPFGVLGDGLRIARQGRKPAAWAYALHSVLLERMLGQAVLLVWVLAVLPLWFGARGVWLALALTGLACWALALVRARGPAAPDSGLAWRRQLVLFVDALAQLAASRRTLGPVLGLSGLILLSIAVQFYCALWSLDLSIAPLAALKVFPLLLLSMSVPLAFAGFGPREVAAATLFGAMQLSRADGLAFSVAFGSLCLCSAAPSMAMALWYSRDAQVDG